MTPSKLINKALRIQNALKLYLKLTGVSQRKLAEDLGVDHTTLSRYINGNECRQRIDIKVFRWLLEEDNITDLTYIK